MLIPWWVGTIDGFLLEHFRCMWSFVLWPIPFGLGYMDTPYNFASCVFWANLFICWRISWEAERMGRRGLGGVGIFRSQQFCHHLGVRHLAMYTVSVCKIIQHMISIAPFKFGQRLNCVSMCDNTQVPCFSGMFMSICYSGLPLT